jgi:hypothetical protein
MTNLANTSEENLNTILDVLYTDNVTLEFTNFTEEDENYILNKGWTIYTDEGVLYVEQTEESVNHWYN